MIRLDECLFDLISYHLKGVCVFRHSSEVYHLVVKALQYKEDLFGSVGEGDKMASPMAVAF